MDRQNLLAILERWLLHKEEAVSEESAVHSISAIQTSLCGEGTTHLPGLQTQV